jgi:putative transposase
MARLSRLTLPGLPHHVIQRGNNRQPIFVDTQDYEAMLTRLHEQSRACAVAVHAYVLMPNHFHLLATPQAADGLPLLMQAVGRSYVRYFNARHGRSGTLWEGRYRSTVLEAERYLVDCMVSIDLNPVRDGLVARASDYPWSSHAHCLGQRNDRLVTPHAQFWALGNTPFAREAAYAQRVEEGLGAQAQTAISESALKGWAMGGAKFLADLQVRTERRVVKAKAGRPRRADRPAEEGAAGDSASGAGRGEPRHPA